MQSSNVFDFLQAMPWAQLCWLFLAGIGLGLLYFGSLWLSTGKLLHSRHPVIWVLGGFVIRVAIMLPVLYWLSDARWQKLLVCLTGFILARTFVLNRSTQGQLPAGWSGSATQRVLSDTSAIHADTMVRPSGLQRDVSHAP